jgi:hypothetical protein
LLTKKLLCSAKVQRLKAAKVHSPIFGVASIITSGDVDERTNA